MATQTAQLIENWAPVMEELEGMPEIKDTNKRRVLAQVL